MQQAMPALDRIDRERERLNALHDAIAIIVAEIGQRDLALRDAIVRQLRAAERKMNVEYPPDERGCIIRGRWSLRRSPIPFNALGARLCPRNKARSVPRPTSRLLLIHAANSLAVTWNRAGSLALVRFQLLSRSAGVVSLLPRRVLHGRFRETIK